MADDNEAYQAAKLEAANAFVKDYPPCDLRNNLKRGFLHGYERGWDAREPEIDAQRAEIERLEAEAERLKSMAKTKVANSGNSRHSWGEDLSCRIDKQIYENLLRTAEAIRRERERERNDLNLLETTLRSKGYRETCDIPACNCGNQWAHGGHADTRLREIYDELGELTQGRTALAAIRYLKAALKEACELLQECEYVDNSGQEYAPQCPICECQMPHHNMGCRLIQLLMEYRRIADGEQEKE